MCCNIMPYVVRKLKGGKVRVMEGKKVIAKKTSIGKANRQVRLLRAIEHGFKPKNKK